MKKYTFQEIKEVLLEVIPNELGGYAEPFTNELTNEDIENLTHDIIMSLEDNLD